MDDEYDLLVRFTEACLNSGKDGDIAFREAVVAANLLQTHVKEQMDFFGDDDGD